MEGKRGTISLHHGIPYRLFHYTNIQTPFHHSRPQNNPFFPPPQTSADHDSDFPNDAFSNLDNPHDSYLEMSPLDEPAYQKQNGNHVSQDLMVDKSWLKSALNGAEKEGQNIFTVVAAALEKHRVATGLEELRHEVKTLRQKNMNLKMQLEEMEKMMDANIEDRERVISQR